MNRILSVLRRKVAALYLQVGLLAWRGCSQCCQFASPSPIFRPSGAMKRNALTHSGGTAPVSHRTSLFMPQRAPELRFSMTDTQEFRLQ